MLMQPTIDTSKYYDPDGGISPENAARLKEESDAWFSELSELRRSVHAGVCVYKGRINEKLQERSARSYEDIVNLIRESAYASTARYDDELTCFSCTADIYMLEEGNVPKCIYEQIEYIDDFTAVYRRAMFMFRRMLLDLPYDEYLAWADETELSVFALEGMLRDMPLGGKDKILGCLEAHFSGLGKEKEAGYLKKLAEVEVGR